MKRRDLLKLMGSTAAAAALGTILPGALLPGGRSLPAFAQTEVPDVVLVENGEPAALLQAALKEFGGLGKFISKGDTVVVKPNIGWDRPPELAGCTNPDLVAEVVKECLNAGAKVVKVFDKTCNNPLRCYENSQIGPKASAAGAEVSQIDEAKFKTVALKNGESVKEWPIYSEYLEADKVINLPIAKHHGMATVTLGLKNLMGVMGGNRGQIHTDFHLRLNDIAGNILPTLTIIDAYRILTRNGPSGGKPDYVTQPRTLIMSPCTLAADISALPLFGHSLDQIPYLQEAVRRKLNRIDLTALKLKKISLS